MKLSSITPSNVMQINTLKNNSSEESNSNNVNFKGISADNILNAMDSYSKANKAQISFCGIFRCNKAPSVRYSVDELRQMPKKKRVALYRKLAIKDPTTLAEIAGNMTTEEKFELCTGCLAVISDERKSDVLYNFLDKASTEPKYITEESIKGFVEIFNSVEDECSRQDILTSNKNQAAKMLVEFDTNNGTEYTNRIIDGFFYEGNRDYAEYVFGREYTQYQKKNPEKKNGIRRFDWQ